MKYVALLSLLILSSCSVSRLSTESDRNQIIMAINDQQIAWNDHDIDGFMKAYWKSDSLKFIGRSGVTYGWEKVHQNYKNNYASAEKMGNLKFDIMHLEALGKRSYRMIGSYRLTFENGSADQSGFFTLIWEKINDKWLISSDHTSGG